MRHFKYIFTILCVAGLVALFCYGETLADTFKNWNNEPLVPLAQESDGDVIEAKAGDRFHINLIKAARKAVRSGKMTRRDFFRLRKAMISPAFRKEVKELAVIQIAASDQIDKVPKVDGGIGDVIGNIDWDKLADFLERLLPLILDFLDALMDIIGGISQSVEPLPPVVPHVYEPRYDLAA